MSNESREQILSDFQDLTGFENVEDCIHVLDENNWNLMNAMQAVHERIGNVNHNEPTTNQNLNTNKRHSESNDHDRFDQSRFSKTIISDYPTIRDLNFTIEHCDQTENFIIFDNETIYQLRLKIFEKISIPPDEQCFLNWKTKTFNDDTILRDLNLPKDNIIHLSSNANGNIDETHRFATTTSSNSSDFPITVLCEDNSGILNTHKLLFKSNSKIREIKEKIEDLTKIPINEQSWKGLLNAKDSDELSKTSIKPETQLIVHRSDTSLNQRIPTNRRHRSIISSEPNDDEQMDTDHDNSLDYGDEDDLSCLSRNNSLTTDNTEKKSNHKSLIPDQCTDDQIALEHFSKIFHERYGSIIPIIYMGSLDQAIQDSLYSSIHTRRPLAIYLHNDQSVCANVFCSQVLSAESIVEYLANNYVLWAWDVTFDSNRLRLFETLRRCVGNQCAQRVSSMENDLFPLILIVIRSRGSLELINIIEGKSTSDEVLLNLIQSHESFEQQRLRDVDEEILRENRENLKKQQEDEYEQSLKADLAKQLAKKEEQDARERKQKQRSQQQQESKDRLPEEPNEKEKNITQLKIRLPDDEGILKRRFRISDSLQVLFDYLASEGRMFGEYKLLTTYPKRDLAILNKTDTFEQLKLYPQEQLILESL